MDNILMTPEPRQSTLVGPVPPVTTNNFGRDKVHWTPDIWDRIDKAVHDEVMRTRGLDPVLENAAETVLWLVENGAAAVCIITKVRRTCGAFLPTRQP